MFVNTNKPLHVSALFIRPFSGAICRALCRYYTVFRWFAFRWIFAWYVAVCVCHLFVCVLGALVSGRSVCELFRSKASKDDV